MQIDGRNIHPAKVIGKTPCKFGLEYWHCIESPDDFVPEYWIRFSVSRVRPVKGLNT